MFLKTQEDLHKLLQEYPIDAYSISIRAWKDRFWEHDSLSIYHHDFSISFEENKIFLTGYNDEKYEYSNEWIQVINIFKKTKQSEWLAREFPIILNWIFLIDTNVSESKRKWKEKMIHQFYNTIEEFANHYVWLKEQLRLLDRLELDEIFRNWDQLSNNSDMRIFYSYYQQSQSDYFASQYFKIIDPDPESFNFHKILEHANNIQVINKISYIKITEELDKFRNSKNPIQKYRNKYWAHHDKQMFHKYNKSERISVTWVQQTRSIIEPRIFREKLKELMDFIDKTMIEYFSSQIWFWKWWWHSEKQFTLKIIQKKLTNL